MIKIKPTLFTPSFGNCLFACYLILKHFQQNVTISSFCISKVVKGAANFFKIAQQMQFACTREVIQKSLNQNSSNFGDFVQSFEP